MSCRFSSNTMRYYLLVCALAMVVTTVASSTLWAAPFVYVTDNAGGSDCGGGKGQIVVVDTETDTVVGTLTNLGWFACPRFLSMSGDTRWLYVGVARQESFGRDPVDLVIKVDPVRDRRGGGVPVDIPWDVESSPDGRLIYTVSNETEELKAIKVYGGGVFKAQEGRAEDCVTTLPQGEKVYACFVGTMYIYDQFLKLLGYVGVGDSVDSTAHPDGSKLYVATMDDIAVLDTSTDTVVRRVPTPAFDLAMLPDGSKLYVHDSPAGGNIVVVDTATDTLTGAVIPGVTSLRDMGATPDSSKVYFVDSWVLKVIDTATDTVTGTVNLPREPGFYFGLTIGPMAGLRKGRLSRGLPGRDRLKLRGSLTLPAGATFDPATDDLTVSLRDSDGVFYTATIAAGSMTELSDRYRFRTSSDTAPNGLRRLDLFKPESPTDAYMDYKLAASRIDLSGADKLDITIDMTLGSSTVSVSRPFVEKGVTLRYP